MEIKDFDGKKIFANDVWLIYAPNHALEIWKKMSV